LTFNVLGAPRPVDFDVPVTVARFPEYCLSSNHIFIPNSHPTDGDHSCLFIGLAGSGKLYLACNLGSSRVLESHVTSFGVTSTFVIFTVNSHEVIFAPLVGLASECCSENDIKSGWERRKVERGSRIVTAVPSTMSLVLQMPRGNLETINPRPLVMEMIRHDLDM
jgi:elongator complex protein 1